MRYPLRRGGVQGGGHDSCIKLDLLTTSPQVIHGSMELFSSKKKRNRLVGIIVKHGDALSALSQSHAELQSKFRNLELEWLNAHEKLKSISGRIAKRQALMEAEDELPPAIPGIDATKPDPYEGLDEVSARIKRRRDGVRRS